MERCYPNSLIGCQFREIVKCFGTNPFIYREARHIVLGPATLKKMEDNDWLTYTRKVKVDGRWYHERRVVPPMKQWADEQEENAAGLSC